MSEDNTKEAFDNVEQALEAIRDDMPRGNIEARVARAYTALGGDVDDVFGVEN